MRKLRYITASATAAAAVLLSAGVAQAAGPVPVLRSPAGVADTPSSDVFPGATTPAPAAPLTLTYKVWNNDPGSCTFGNACWMWYATGPTLFLGDPYNMTGLSTSVGCVSGFCEHKLHDGNCMAFYASGSKGTDLVDEHTCNGATYELWKGTAFSDGSTEWTNAYLGLCPSGFARGLQSTDPANTEHLIMHCPPNPLSGTYLWIGQVQ